MIDERISRITDLTLREREIANRQNQIKYQEELSLALGNDALKEKAYNDFVLRKLEIDKGYLEKSRDLQDIAIVSLNKFAEAFAKSMQSNAIDPIDEQLSILQKKIDEIKSPESKSDLESIKDEEAAIIESYKNRETSAEEFQNKLNDLNRKRVENQLKQEEGLSQSMLELQKGVVEGFKLVQGNFNVTMAETSKRVTTQVKLNMETLRTEGKSKTASLSDIFEGATQDLEDFALAGVGSAVAGFGALLAAGEDAGTAFRKGLLVDLVKTAEQAILTLIPQIYAQFAAWMGPFGYAAATGAILTVYAGLSAAKAALGRKTGEVDINGVGTSTSDDNLRFLSNHESVLTANATMSPYSAELYKWQNKTGGSPIEYFTKVNPVPFNSHIDKLISRRMSERTDFIIAKASNSSSSRELQEIKSEMQLLRKAVESGNYSRKQHSRVDVNLNVNDRELINRVEQNKMKVLGRI